MEVWEARRFKVALCSYAKLYWEDRKTLSKAAEGTCSVFLFVRLGQGFKTYITNYPTHSNNPNTSAHINARFTHGITLKTCV